MFANRIVPLVVASALMTGGVASAQGRPPARGGFPPATTVRFAPRPYFPPPVYVTPKPVYIAPKPVFVPPVVHYQPQVYGYKPFHYGYAPPFWSGLWGNYPAVTVNVVNVVDYNWSYPNVGWFGW